MKKIIIISQWPDTKNAEYELIEKIKRSQYEICVCDIYGNCLETKDNINTPDMNEKYAFAISLHYSTPKILNIKTYLWIANPLTFMHMDGSYARTILPKLRSYDGYLFNGSDFITNHINRIKDPEATYDEGVFYPSCADKDLIPSKNKPLENKLFYCGINWERCSDKDFRGQQLFQYLDELNQIHFYGPNTFNNIQIWEGISNYEDEIPFDGFSLNKKIQEYAAVLALSSPAHIASKTSSSRVFEGFSSGVPVISDKNNHVQKLFGDLVYYFDGETDEERARNINSTLTYITNNWEEAQEKVAKAQKLIKEKYSFDCCFKNMMARENETQIKKINNNDKSMGINIYTHSPIGTKITVLDILSSAYSALRAAQELYTLYGVKIQINIAAFENLLYDISLKDFEKSANKLPGIKVNFLNTSHISNENWDLLCKGEKIRILANLDRSDYSKFLNQDELLQYDDLKLGYMWFQKNETILSEKEAIYISGSYFISNYKNIIISNKSNSVHKWSSNSLSECASGSLMFNSFSKKTLQKIENYSLDLSLPISMILSVEKNNGIIYRAPFLTLKEKNNYFGDYLKHLQDNEKKGFWFSQYYMKINVRHELNYLYDVHLNDKSSLQAITVISSQLIDIESSTVNSDERIRRLEYRINRIYPVKPLANIFVFFKKIKNFIKGK